MSVSRNVHPLRVSAVARCLPSAPEAPVKSTGLIGRSVIAEKYLLIEITGSIGTESGGSRI